MTDFLWGAATSSHQIEGDNVHNDWWAWEEQGRTEGGARSGKATDHWKRFHEDLKLAADLGLNSYRFSVEWSRLEPSDGTWDESPLDWYEALVGECEKLGLLPMRTLHHFTSPKWFADRGGFTAADAPDRFAEYATRVVARLGARVPLWCTLNEPMVLVGGSYLGTFMPPGKFSPRMASQACHGLLRSHVKAYDIIHRDARFRARTGPWASRPVQV
ncbi:MAG: glycoside hydrolase family 1 protein, partial [Deltaproteobacteria bacterium]|nr:glycoside hydrolase family 1 protein [Deltaproteobacteria bacterium]